MFGPLGVPELLFILVLALLIFGPKKLPEIGRTVGKAMGEFRRASNELRRTINTEIALEEESKPAVAAIRHPAVDSESVPRAEAASGPPSEAPSAPGPAAALAAAPDPEPAGDAPQAAADPADVDVETPAANS
jgi:TatA/E family protein of Tat protein translocase